MSESKFKPGDRVQHLSGGPVLVVVSTGYIPATAFNGDFIRVTCEFWDESKKAFVKQDFVETSLEDYE
ncbi:hypothetical protein [Escherichia coli]|uniref:hypothetical protein n=1 Tax=Escherichia TaxID=561 RepID=UPI000BEACCEE|nr:hypothetical protein [Escherichia coli]HEB1538799.1 hypothetical protein [Escherichia albertii]EEW2394757.1 hypothetical protein [Escherichia coli]EEZ8329796.1 hypothetical protein [Escherichia coli]EFA9310863.1 hypothetical protein [Escherichia coli]EFA9346608.1 hypothetical protein [Escherichia coli]